MGKVVLKLLGGLFLAVHILTVVIGVIVAWFWIQSIVLTGMVLAPTSLGIALISLFFSCVRTESQRSTAIIALVGYSLFVWRFVQEYRRERASYFLTT